MICGTIALYTGYYKIYRKNIYRYVRRIDSRHQDDDKILTDL